MCVFPVKTNNRNSWEIAYYSAKHGKIQGNLLCVELLLAVCTEICCQPETHTAFCGSCSTLHLNQLVEGYSQDLGQSTVQDSGNVNRIWLWLLPREQVLSNIFRQGCVTGKENDIWEGDGKTLGCRIHVKKEQICGISPSPPPPS